MIKLPHSTQRSRTGPKRRPKRKVVRTLARRKHKPLPGNCGKTTSKIQVTTQEQKSVLRLGGQRISVVFIRKSDGTVVKKSVKIFGSGGLVRAKSGQLKEILEQINP